MASLLDVLNLSASRAAVTRQEFGEIMHDDSISDEEKFKVLEEVQDLGGYDNLPED